MKPHRTPAVPVCVGRVLVMLGTIVVLFATSCMHLQTVPRGYRLGSAMEQDGVLPEGAVWRESPSSQSVCVFGVMDPAAQDRVVEGARDSIRRLWGPRSAFGRISVQFWSGEPPPTGVAITVKERAPIRGEPEPTEVAERNARYGISLIRTVQIEGPLGDTSP